MNELLLEFLGAKLNLVDPYDVFAYLGIITLSIGVLAYVANLIGKKIILSGVKRLIIKTKTKKDEAFYNRKVFHLLINYLPVAVFYLASSLYGDYSEVIRKILMFITLFITVTVIFRSLDSFNDIYMEKEYAKSMPIKGLLQVIKIFVVIFASSIVLLAFNTTSTAMTILGSLGGLSAVVILIFKDSILGFVAGIQLTMNNLLKIGDWIEMPDYQADGEVVDVSLTKVSVKNWDKTIAHIPAYKFIEDSFINWDNMSQSGGRRIKRNLLIDVTSIDFLTLEKIEELKSIDILKEYLESKESVLEEYNKDKLGLHAVVNRRLTNIGTFRAYVEQYLRTHPQVKQNDTLLVRQREAQGNGLPIQVYCFSNDTRWAYYESIQSDIFDHLYAVLDQFGLRAYQSPTGNDFKTLKN